MPGIKSVNVSNDTYYGSVRDILHSTLEALQAEYGAVSLTNGENGSLQSYVSYGSLPSQGAGSSVAHWVTTHGESLVLETQDEVLMVPDLVINKRECLPLICIPIQVRGTTLGALQASFTSFAGHEELRQQRHALKLAADLIGYVIENATLRNRLHETKELMRNLSKSSLEIQEKERERLIIEVHDGIAQTLASAFQYLQTLESIGDFREEHSRQLFVRTAALIRQAIQETREIITSITPATLDVLGLVTTLGQELKQFEKETECQVNFRLA